MKKENFKNTILVVVFNYSNCVNNKEFIKKMYEKHFKKIIFYSDTPINDDSEINYLSINRGFNTHKIFPDLYSKYKNLINESDGIFYTMDDNIINLNILNNFTADKIIYNYQKNKPLEEYNGWWWTNNFNGGYGKKAILSLQNDEQYKNYMLNEYSGNFSDWFFLPKRYLTEKVFQLFELFSKYEVFLEISIPTIINYIESNIENYHTYNITCLWDDRNKLTVKNSFYDILNSDSLFIHPIKFNQNPESKNWLTEIFNLEN